MRVVRSSGGQNGKAGVGKRFGDGRAQIWCCEGDGQMMARIGKNAGADVRIAIGVRAWRGGHVGCEMCTPLDSGTWEELSIRTGVVTRR